MQHLFDKCTAGCGTYLSKKFAFIEYFYVLEDRTQKEIFFDKCDISQIHVPRNAGRIYRIKTLPHHKVNYWLRGIAQILMQLQFYWRLIQIFHKFDVTIVYSPPLPLSFVGVLTRVLGSKFILNVQDIFPQNAIDLDQNNGWSAGLVTSIQIQRSFWFPNMPFDNVSSCTESHHKNDSKFMNEIFESYRVLETYFSVSDQLACINKRIGTLEKSFW